MSAKVSTSAEWRGAVFTEPRVVFTEHKAVFLIRPQGVWQTSVVQGEPTIAWLYGRTAMSLSSSTIKEGAKTGCIVDDTIISCGGALSFHSFPCDICEHVAAPCK